jgi:hypothetical protein
MKNLALVLFFAASIVGMRTAVAAPVTVCELTNSPNSFDGKDVTVSAVYMTDMLERSLLADSHCPGVTLSPYDSVSPHPDPSNERFNAAVTGNVLDRKLRVFKVVVVGRFNWDASAKQGRLTFERVLHFKSTTLKASGL